MDGERAYAVIDVIGNNENFQINDENDDEEQPQSRLSVVQQEVPSVTDLMIAQFFTEVEGPDRDWKDDYGYEDEDRESLFI